MTAAPPNLTLPDEAGPEDRLDPASALCTLGAQPYLVTALLVQILRDHFADTQQIADTALRERFERDQPWTPQDSTGILIEPVGKWDPKKAEKRLGIYVIRKTWQLQRIGIGDFVSNDYLTGVENFSAMWQGGHKLACTGATEPETEILATEVARLMLRFGPTIVETLNLHRFQVVAIEEAQEIKEVSQHRGVPVQLAYAANESWSVIPDAPRLKRIEFLPSISLGMDV